MTMEDISLHILDIAENSISAGATLIKITISVDTPKDLFSVEIEDIGKGIPEAIKAKVLDPFYTTRATPKVRQRNFTVRISLGTLINSTRG